MFGGLGHQQPGQLVPGERVEVGHRLVEQQQLGPLAEGEGEGDAGALAAREGADTGAERHLAGPDDPLGQRLVPARVELTAQPQRLGHREAG